MDRTNALPVDAERKDKLKKAKPDKGFYNIIDGEKVSASKRPSVINPATGKQLAAVPDVDRALLNITIRKLPIEKLEGKVVTLRRNT
jgi:hypothetical protein